MIKIKVDGQCAHKLNTPVIAAGAVNFLFLQAEFSPDWDGLNKSYIFTNGGVCIQIESDGDKVAVPVEVLTEGEFTVGIKGIRLNEKLDSVEVKATHNALTYRVHPSGIDGMPQNAGTLSPSVTEQLRDAAKNLVFVGDIIAQGTGEGSVKTKGSDAISDYSMALGDGVTAGRKAYYIKSIDKNAKKIYLSEVQVTPVFSTADNTDKGFATPAFEANDEFSVIDGLHYILCGVISSVSNNVVTYSDPLPFNAFTQTPGEDDHTFSVPSKPDIGCVTLGKSAFSAGESNSAAGRSSFAAGRDNVAAGNFAAVFGRQNKAGYASLVGGFGNRADKGCFASGYYNTAIGTSAHVSGDYNTSEGDYSHVAGLKNNAKGFSNHVVGHSNKVSGDHNRVGGASNTVSGYHHSVSGHNNVVNGYENMVHGLSNEVSGDYQFVTGVFSKKAPDKLFIVGYGQSESQRKNIMELDKNGNLYLAGAVISSLSDDYLYMFDNYRMVDRFVSSTNTKVSCYDRSMKVVSQNSDPIICHTFDNHPQGTQYPYIKLRYKVEGAGTSDGIIFFTTEENSALTKKKFTITADGMWHDAVIDMSTCDGWDGLITSLRIDIPNDSQNGYVAYFKYIGLFHDMDEAQSFEV